MRRVVGRRRHDQSTKNPTSVFATASRILQISLLRTERDQGKVIRISMNLLMSLGNVSNFQRHLIVVHV